jgi:hypothetical protein
MERPLRAFHSLKPSSLPTATREPSGLTARLQTCAPLNDRLDAGRICSVARTPILWPAFAFHE